MPCSSCGFRPRRTRSCAGAGGCGGSAVAADRPLADAEAAQDDRRPAVLLPRRGGGGITVAAGNLPGAKRHLVLAAIRARRVDGPRVVVRFAARDALELGVDPRDRRGAERLPAQLVDVAHQLAVRPAADDRHAVALEMVTMQVGLARGESVVLVDQALVE